MKKDNILFLEYENMFIFVIWKQVSKLNGHWIQLVKLNVLVFFLQQIDEKISEVICHYMNEKQCVAKIQIETIKLQQI